MSIFKGGNTAELQQKVVDLTIENARLQAKLEAAELRVEDYRNQVSAAQAQVERLQSALVAKEAPEAHRERVMKEMAAAESQEDKEERIRRSKMAEINKQLVGSMEADLFKDAEDMMDLLAGNALSPFKEND